MTGSVDVTSGPGSCWSTAIAPNASGVAGVGECVALDVEVGLCGARRVQHRAVGRASLLTLSQADASSVPEAPPKETRGVAPSCFSPAIRSSTAVPERVGAVPTGRAWAAVGDREGQVVRRRDARRALSDAVVALRGAYDVPTTPTRPARGSGGALRVAGRRVRRATGTEAACDCQANRQLSPSRPLRKHELHMPLVTYVSGPKRKGNPAGKSLTYFRSWNHECTGYSLVNGSG